MSSTLAPVKVTAPRREAPRSASAEPVTSQVPDAVPHFKSFNHIADARVRRAKDYGQYLEGMVSRFPEFAERINSEIAWARLEGARSKTSDRDRICDVLLKQGELLRSEIAEETGLPSSTVHTLLREMLDQGLVAARERAGAQGNRPMLIWSLPRELP